MDTSAARHTIFRVLRIAIIAVLVVLLLPYVLTPLYLVVNPVSTPMMWRWVTGARVERTWVRLDAVAPVLPRTVIAAEDARFWSHRGVDFRELKEAIADAEDLRD